MATADAKTTISTDRVRLPDPPQREPDEMTQYDQLFKTGASRDLAIFLGNPQTTLVEADRWIIAHPSDNRSRARRPDLLVAFNADPAAYAADNGYIVSEQGKPPDFVLEIASEATAETDTGAKRADYAALGVLEYWRFDETGEHHGAKLAGDRLFDGVYQPISIEELDTDVLQAYSTVLNLNLRWDHGRLGWHDPATGRHIPTHEDERQRADNAEAELQAVREAAEVRIRELEERLQHRP
jgi:Uma2 family endonuclease